MENNVTFMYVANYKKKFFYFYLIILFVEIIETFVMNVVVVINCIYYSDELTL